MRILNRPLAFLLAVFLLAAGVLLVIEVIGYAINSRHVFINWMAWQRWADRTHWNRAVIKTWSIVLIVVGGLLLAAELKRPKVQRLALHSAEDATDAAITRKGVAGTLRAAATDVDGVSNAAVTLARGKARVSVTTAVHDSESADTLRQPVAQAVQDRLDGLNLSKPPQLAVRVTPRRS
jgi:Family of unknown function (DUF6286)